SRLFRREPGQPDRLPARHRIRWTILRIPSTGSAATTTRLHRSSSHLSPGRTLIARGSLAILIRDRLPRLNLHIESTERMAVGTPPKRPCRNNTTCLLPSRDSAPQHSACRLCDSNDPRRSPHTRRHGCRTQSALLVPTNRLASNRGLTRDRPGSNLARSWMATALVTRSGKPPRLMQGPS